MGEIEKPGRGTFERPRAQTPAERESALREASREAARKRLASEDVIINAPMSFAGAFQRLGLGPSRRALSQVSAHHAPSAMA